MNRQRQAVHGLLVVLPLLAGGVVGCGTTGRPGGATVPIGGGVGESTAQAPAQPERPAQTTAATSGSTRSGGTTATTSTTASTAPAPAAAPAAPMSGSSVAFFPTGRRETSTVMLEKMAPSEVAAGANAAYQIKVTNISNTTIDNVIVDEDLPEGFTFASSTPNGTRQDRAMAFNLGRMAPNSSQVITINGSFARAGSYGSCATVSYTIPVCMTVNVVSPALQLTKTAPAETLLCDAFPVKLVVTNTGTGTARGVVVRDPLPAGLTTSDGNNVVEVNVGDLGAGQSREVTFNAKAGRVGSFSNQATAQSSNGLNATSNTTVTEAKAPTLTITKRCPDRVLIGRAMRFEITVTNTGNAVAANTVVRDTIPAGTTFASATDGGTAGAGVVTWNLGNLAPGASRTVSLTLNGGSAGALTNTATATAVCAADVNATCSTTLAGVPDIGTGIDDVDGVVDVGNTHVFTYKVRNQGQANLTNVKVVAELDAGLEFVSTTFRGGATNLTWNVGTLTPGQEVSFDIVVRGTTPGEKVIRTTTTSTEMRPVRNDEQVNYIPAP